MNPWWLVRMARILRHPPSKRTVLMWLGIIAIALLIVGFERVFGWPEALTVNEFGRGRLR